MLMTESSPALPEWARWIRFERVMPEQNCYREYEIGVTQDLFGEWVLIRSWGRIGGRHRTMAMMCPGREDAAKVAQRIAHRRLSRGYRVAESD